MEEYHTPKLELPSTPSSESYSFPYASLEGDWFIVASSLPLWKGRKDVVINYKVESIPSISRSQLKGKGKLKETGLAVRDEMWWEELAENDRQSGEKGLSHQHQDAAAAATATTTLDLNNPSSFTSSSSTSDLSTSSPPLTAIRDSATSKPIYNRSNSAKRERSFASRVISSSISKGSSTSQVGDDSVRSRSGSNATTQGVESEHPNGKLPSPNLKKGKNKKKSSIIRGVSRLDPKGNNG